VRLKDIKGNKIGGKIPLNLPFAKGRGLNSRNGK